MQATQANERHLQERLGSALFRLESLKRLSTEARDPARLAGRLNGDLPKIAAELERALQDVQGLLARFEDLRQRAVLIERRAQVFFELSPVPALVLEPDATVVQANPSATGLLNVSLRHLVGRPFELFVAEERESFLFTLRTLAVANEVQRWSARVRPREQSPIGVTMVASADPSGAIVLLLAPAGVYPAAERAAAVLHGR